MQTLEKALSQLGIRARQSTANVRLGSISLCVTLAFLALFAGCRRDPGAEASDSDANGYLCLKCNARFYTDRSVFIGPLCPKCKQSGLVEVVSYVCPKDNHVTIVGRSDDRYGAPVCEACKSPLSGMRLPREKDLKAWGATKVSS